MAGGGSHWSRELYSSAEVAEGFSGHNLPRFLLVQDGFYVESNPELSVCQGDVLELHGIQVQQCVVSERLGEEGERGKRETALIPMNHPGMGYVSPPGAACAHVWQLPRLKPLPRYAISTRRYRSLKDLDAAPVHPFLTFEIVDQLGTGLKCRLIDKPGKPVVVLPYDFQGNFQILPDPKASRYCIQDALRKHQCPVGFTFEASKDPRQSLSGTLNWSGHFILKELTDIQVLVCSAWALPTDQDEKSAVNATTTVFSIPATESEHGVTFRVAHTMPANIQQTTGRRRRSVSWKKVCDLLSDQMSDPGKVQGIETDAIYETLDRGRTPTSKSEYVNVTFPDNKPLVSTCPKPPPAVALKPARRTRTMSQRLPGAVPVLPVSPSRPVNRVQPHTQAAATASLRSRSEPESDQSSSESSDSEGDYVKMTQPSAANKEVESPEVIFDSVEDIPTDLRHLAVEELAAALRLLSLPQVANVCEHRLVDGEVFMELDEEDFKEEPFNLKGLPLRKIIKVQKHGWRPNRRGSLSQNQPCGNPDPTGVNTRL